MHNLQKNKNNAFSTDDILILIHVTQIITDLKYLLAYSARSKSQYASYRFYVFYLFHNVLYLRIFCLLCM